MTDEQFENLKIGDRIECIVAIPEQPFCAGIDIGERGIVKTKNKIMLIVDMDGTYSAYFTEKSGFGIFKNHFYYVD